MKALMVNSTSGNYIDQKMRDQMYMKHLREVQKISNRQAENVAKVIKNYKSINDLHHKHKSYAFEWNNKEEKSYIEERNNRMKQKISQIRSYFQSKTQRKKATLTQQASSFKLETAQNQDKNPEHVKTFKNEQMMEQDTVKESRKSQQKQLNKEKRQNSLHYRYRKRRQEQIDLENSKLVKAIHSQRSSYLPKIYRNKQKNEAKCQSLQRQGNQLPEQNDKI